MKSSKGHKPAAVALLQLGPEVHAALESAALRSGQNKSEFVRHAVLGAIQAQAGYWERLLMDVLRLIPELIEAASYAGLLTEKEAANITEPMDQARSRLYGVLDRIDKLPIHWTPGKGEAARPYEEVMRIRASRAEMLRPETEPLDRLTNRFIELHNTLHRAEREKAKKSRRKSPRP
ncbi:MAG: hypothetical protein WBF06_01860 [Candidatus Acidiferrales bacterium]